MLDTTVTADQELVHAEEEEPPSLRGLLAGYESVSAAKEWNSWQWQLSHRITDKETLSRVLSLSPSEQMLLSNCSFPFAVTPYYASLIDPFDPMDPLRLCVVPRAEELLTSMGESMDPLSEEHHEEVPGLVHRYPDRVLFLVTDCCSTYCRYCTRARQVGKQKKLSARWQLGIDYIKRHTEIRDVLISGGDPLILPDKTLDYLLSQIRAIPHVEIIRIGTKTPTVLPQRITPSLCRVLKKYHPLFISLHAAHPNEFTREATLACEMLADAGIPLGSQTVLLKGVNDNAETMKKLMHKLLKARIKPYYLYQCDPIKGTSHFRTTVETGLEIIRQLRGHTSGYAVPTFVIDAPGGGGKVPISDNNVIGEENGELLIRNYEGKVYKYPLSA